jgi:hypothetical protein
MTFAQASAIFTPSSTPSRTHGRALDKPMYLLLLLQPSHGIQPIKEFFSTGHLMMLSKTRTILLQQSKLQVSILQSLQAQCKEN